MLSLLKKRNLYKEILNISLTKLVATVVIKHKNQIIKLPIGYTSKQFKAFIDKLRLIDYYYSMKKRKLVIEGIIYFRDGSFMYRGKHGFKETWFPFADWGHYYLHKNEIGFFPKIQNDYLLWESLKKVEPQKEEKIVFNDKPRILTPQERGFVEYPKYNIEDIVKEIENALNNEHSQIGNIIYFRIDVPYNLIKEFIPTLKNLYLSRGWDNVIITKSRSLNKTSVQLYCDESHYRPDNNHKKLYFYNY